MGMRTANDYHAQLRALLPPGPAWDAEQVPAIDGVLQVYASLLAQADGLAYGLLDEADPRTFNQIVPDWERVMQLPDSCLGELPTLEDRKIAVRQRLVGIGGQTPAFMVELAIGQGYADAQVVEHRAPRFGRSRCGHAHFGTWTAQFMWTLYTGQRKRLGRRFGASYFSERFGANPTTALECLIRRAAPAHTVEFINYQEAP